jgi:hypothetical protein
LPAITHVAPGHRSGHGIPDARLDARRLVGDDQNELAMIALKVLRLIGRKPNREVVVVAEFKFGGFQFWIRNFGAFYEPVDFRPELGSHLALSGRRRQDDPLGVACQPPQRRNRDRECLPDSVTGLHCGSPVTLNRP